MDLVTLAADADTVELTIPGRGTVAFSATQAHELSRALALFAEKANIIAVRGPDAAVGPRKAALTF